MLGVFPMHQKGIFELEQREERREIDTQVRAVEVAFLQISIKIDIATQKSHILGWCKSKCVFWNYFSHFQP